MTMDIKTALSELAEVAPRGVDTMAGTALRTATTRRRRRTAVTVGACTIVVCLGLGVALVGVPSLQRDAVVARGSDGIGYPQRIEGPLPSKLTPLPARPGRLAGLMRTGFGWHGIRADGGLYQISRYRPAVSLSPNGRYLTYLDPLKTINVRDLVEGTTTRFEELTAQRRSGAGNEFQLTSENPDIFWSPDSTRFAVGLARPSLLDTKNHLARTAVVDPDTQAKRIVEAPGYVTGFAGNNHTLVSIPFGLGYGGDIDPAVRIVNISGQVINALRPRVIFEMINYGADASVSPDGSRLAVTDAFNGRFAYLDLRTGRIDRRPSRPVEGCSTSWYSESTAAIFGLSGPKFLEPRRLWTVPPGERQPWALTVVDPRITLECLHLTRAALEGPAANGEFLGVRTANWTWQWRELVRQAAVTLVVLVLVIPLMRRWLRRRGATRRRRSSATAETRMT